MLRRGARVALAALLVGCAAAPYTRRSQLILISPEEENKLGARAFQEVLGKSHVDERAQVSGPVGVVGQRVARVAERPDYKWRFVVIDDPKQQNAFALPGGKVAVYTGLFPLAQDTSGLAVVLGHEIAHALARHGAERISQGVVAETGQSLLGAVLGTSPGANAILARGGGAIAARRDCVGGALSDRRRDFLLDSPRVAPSSRRREFFTCNRHGAGVSGPLSLRTICFLYERCDGVMGWTRSSLRRRGGGGVVGCFGAAAATV